VNGKAQYDKQTRERGERPRGRNERIERGKHPRARNKGNEKKNPLGDGRARSEERAHRPAVPSVLSPERKKKGASAKIQQAGKKERGQIPIRKEPDKLCSRDKPRADTRADEKERHLERVHFLCFMRFSAPICLKIQKKCKIMSDIVL